MPLFGKPPGEQPRKSFNLAQQNGEQVDSVRSKIASLMDGVTEKRRTEAAAPPESTDELAEHTQQLPVAPSLSNHKEENHKEETVDETVHTQQPMHHDNTSGGSTSSDKSGKPPIETNRWWEEEQVPESQADVLRTTNGVNNRDAQPLPRNMDDGLAVDFGEPDTEQPSRARTSHTQFEQREIDKSQLNNEWPRQPDWHSSSSMGNGPIADGTNPEPNRPSQRAEQTNRPPQELEDSQTRPTFTKNNRFSVSDFATSQATNQDDPPPSRPPGPNVVGGTPSSAAPSSMADAPTWDAQRQPAASAQQDQGATASAIHIKGRTGGILIEIGHGEWPMLMASLADRLAGAGHFFRNGAVALDLAARPLTEAELHQLHKMLADQALELVLVNTASQETFQVALDMGLSAKLETLDGETAASAQPAQSNLSNEPHFVYAGHLRAGQVLQRLEHILIIGDVNPGATVISNGDILVWGNLRGLAHAGAGGDTQAVIAALHLTPVQLRISDYVAIAPEPEPKRRWGRQQAPSKQAEVAYIHSDRIIVEPWDATKFGGIAALRQ